MAKENFEAALGKLEELVDAVKDLGFSEVAITRGGYREGGVDSWVR